VRLTNDTEVRGNDPVFVKFHWISNQGKAYMGREEAKRLAGENSDFMTQDLYDSIASGDFPSWTLHIQVRVEGGYKYNIAYVLD
jgi:catalase